MPKNEGYPNKKAQFKGSHDKTGVGPMRKSEGELRSKLKTETRMKRASRRNLNRISKEAAKTAGSRAKHGTHAGALRAGDLDRAKAKREFNRGLRKVQSGTAKEMGERFDKQKAFKQSAKSKVTKAVKGARKMDKAMNKGASKGVSKKLETFRNLKHKASNEFMKNIDSGERVGRLKRSISKAGQRMGKFLKRFPKLNLPSSFNAVNMIPKFPAKARTKQARDKSKS